MTPSDGKAIGAVPVSVLVPVFNEQENLPDALASVRGADQVLVIDSGSTDATADIARQAGAEVLNFEYPGHGPKKKAWAFRNADFRNEWVLWIDADERVTPDLWAEIEGAVRGDEAEGYCLDREFIFMGRSLRCFRPNWIPRLFKLGCADFEDLGLHELAGTGPNEMHENLIVDGRLGYLESPLLHHDFRGITRWIDRHNTYSIWEAEAYRMLRAERIEVGPIGLLRLDPFRRRRVLRRIWPRIPAAARPPLRFLIWYGPRQGFRDGREGLAFCLLMAWYELLIALKLRETQAGAPT